jgi:hypothetical protein
MTVRKQKEAGTGGPNIPSKDTAPLTYFFLVGLTSQKFHHFPTYHHLGTKPSTSELLGDI